MKPTVRCQAAILQGDQLLLLKVWDHSSNGESFWVIPGGGQLPDECEEDCLKREVLEETHLRVEVERLILDETNLSPSEGMYQGIKTYTCRISNGDPQPGIEPEVDTAQRYTIIEIGWFDLRYPQTWDVLALNNPITYQNLNKLRKALGYVAE